MKHKIEYPQVKPYLTGSPRVHYMELEYVEEEDSYDAEGAYYYYGSLFDGVVWSEFKGFVREDTMKDGLPNGLCVKIHANGQLAESGTYKDDEPIEKHTCWYESGVVSKVSIYEEDSKEILREEYNPQGILTWQVEKGENWRLRRWTQDGTLIYESTNEESRFFAPNGQCLILIDDKTRIAEYMHDELYKHAYGMLSESIETVELAIFDWIIEQLEAQNKKALDLMGRLLSHPNEKVVVNALTRAWGRGMEKHLPLVQKLKESAPKKGYSTIANSAEVAYARITGKGNLEEIFNKHHRVENEWKQYRESRLLKVKRKWPRTQAEHKEVYTLYSTIKTGIQVFSGEPVSEKKEYAHVYYYVVSGKTYRATYSNYKENPPQLKEIKYREKNPEEYFFDE